MKRLAVIAFFVSAFCAPSVGALAADMAVKAPPSTFEQRWYVESRFALGVLPKYSISTTGLGDGTYAPGHGFNVAFDVGIYLTRNWRAEIEVDWANIGGGTAYGFAHSGNARILTLLGNVLYSFDLAPWVRPYVGAGLGFANMQVNRIGAIGGAFVIDGSDTAFAGALHAGLDFPVWQRLAITSRYTMLWISSASFGSIPAGVTVTKKSSIDNIFSVGLRFSI